MECSEFLARFSEFFDRDPALSDRPAFEAHLESCRSCRRYTRVVERGGSLLRELPFPELRADFFPRLKHRVFHLDQEDASRKDTAGSGTTAATAMAVAALLVIAAWYPALQEAPPAVDLPAIVVQEPPPHAPFPPSRVSSFSSSTASSPGHEASLWSRSNQLLYEHSALGRRHRDPGAIHAGLR